jgi:hypothetical protein
MKTLLDIGDSNGTFWRCVGEPTEAPGQSCAKIPTFQLAAAIGLVICLIILIAVILSPRRRRT